MKGQLEQAVSQYTQKRNRRKIWYRIISSICAVAVFFTTYGLMLPAITMEADKAVICGMVSHTHDESCYDASGKLTCTIPEHEHDMACYEGRVLRAKASYRCGFDYEHTHTDACYADGTLVCTMQEHTHSDDCLTNGLRELTLESAPAADGAVAIVSGWLPADAAATISRVSLSAGQLNGYLGAETAGAVDECAAYDIKIMVGDTEWQPNESVRVTVRSNAIDAAAESVYGAHVDGKTNAVSGVDVEPDGNGQLCFTADGFSVYIFYTYTVDFHYNGVDASIDGGSTATMAELFGLLSIDRNAAEIVRVKFSDPALVAPEETDDGWQLRSLAPFTSEEKLTVTFADGSVLIIDVTDAQGGTSGDDTDPGDKAPDISKRIDAFRDGDKNPDTDLDDKASDLTDLYRLYLDAGPETSLTAVDVLFIVDRSTSMESNEDATDLKGKTGVSRQLAMNSLLNGQGTMGENNTSTLYDNAINSIVLRMNPENKIAVGGFADKAYDVGLDNAYYGWTSKGMVTQGTTIWGTNYVAALQKADAMLQDSAVKNDGRQKIMIFLSDGRPTTYCTSLTDPVVYAGSLYNAAVKHHSDIQKGSDTELASCTTQAIKDFKAKYPDLKIYTIGIGNNNSDKADFVTYLTPLSTNGKCETTGEIQEIVNMIDESITRGVGHYSNLEIVDQLSAYVDFYFDNLDVVVQMIPEKSTDGKGTVLYTGDIESGALVGSTTTAGKDIITSVTLDKDKKTITATFNPSYQEVGGYRYSLSFNVKVNQHAYDTYAKSEYSGVKGDPGTDYTYNGNVTSSNQGGFHSNTTATLTYTQTHAGEEPETGKTVEYPHPAVQVSTTELTVNKVWSDGNAKHEADNVTVELYRKLSTSTGEPTATGKTANLKKYNNWAFTFTGLAKGYDYSVVETSGKTGYFVKYEYNPSTKILTVTNTPAGDPLPGTGGSGAARWYALGIAALATALFGGMVFLIERYLWPKPEEKRKMKQAEQ